MVTALPSGAGESTANSVACGSATSCVIAGGAFLSGAPRRMVLRWNGTTWTVETLPAEPATSEASLLFGASCASATNCVVTGASAFSIDVLRRTFLRWNGTTWTAVNAPVPTGAVTSELDGVSCLGATACTSVGNFQITDDHALVVRVS